ncbi:MAG: DinB family protein [Bacteroidia bacterium]|nr:DinB family protein [Bacteroidia bacterium]
MTQQLLQLFRMGRTRLSNQFPNIQEKDLSKKLHPDSNSIGFLLRHISDVEYLFAKNVFGLDVKVKTFTVGIGLHDSGKFTVLEEEIKALSASAATLEQAILMQKEEDWEKSITTAQFGTITKTEALARIVSHTAYHAGQIGLILKYGA